MKKFEIWCEEWYEKDACNIEDKDTCPIRMGYEGEEALRMCAERSTPKTGGVEIMNEKIQLVTNIGLLLLDSMRDK